MNTNNTIKNLAAWIRSLLTAAENDSTFDVSWFKDTENEPFSIVGGWLESGFDPINRDIFCLSESEPKYAMAIKVITNDGPYTYCTFETLNMPVDKNSEVDDTLIILEWAEDPEALAKFIYGEWERIMEEYKG